MFYKVSPTRYVFYLSACGTREKTTEFDSTEIATNLSTRPIQINSDRTLSKGDLGRRPSQGRVTMRFFIDFNIRI